MNIERNVGPEDRYIYDFDRCSFHLGWAQLDTPSDAWYYGSWANPGLLQIITFCEGDETITTCNTEAEFIAEIRTMAQWHKENDGGFAIDAYKHKAAWITLGLTDLLYSAFRR